MTDKRGRYLASFEFRTRLGLNDAVKLVNLHYGYCTEPATGRDRKEVMRARVAHFNGLCDAVNTIGESIGYKLKFNPDENQYELVKIFDL